MTTPLPCGNIYVDVGQTVAIPARVHGLPETCGLIANVAVVNERGVVVGRAEPSSGGGGGRALLTEGCKCRQGFFACLCTARQPK